MVPGSDLPLGSPIVVCSVSSRRHEGCESRVLSDNLVPESVEGWGRSRGVGVCVSEPLVNVVAKQRGAICQGSRPGLG